MVPWGTRTRSYKKGSSSKNFRTSRVGFRLLRKNDKKEGRPKVEPLSALWNRKVNHGLSKKQHQKEEKMRNRERLNLLGDGTKQALVPREQNRRINGSPGL